MYSFVMEQDTSGHASDIPEHYAYVTRSLMRLFHEGKLSNVTAIDVEPNYGYTARITYTNETYRVTYGNDLGLNPGAASDLAKDKGHTKFMLRTIGVNCPQGKEFLLPWWAEQIGPSQQQRGNAKIKDTSMAADYIAEIIGYPAYIKPVDGSKGSGVTKVMQENELSAVFDEFSTKRVRVAIVEEAINMPDYRVVVLDGELISAYQRIPITVTGDGKRSVAELIDDLQQAYLATGRDTRFSSGDERFSLYLQRSERSLATIPEPGETVQLSDISNLSAGGTSVDVTETIHPRWIELATYVAKNFNLRLCGVDLACEDIADAEAEYSVLEVNAAPGLDHYALSGMAQQEIVDKLYTRVFNAFPIRK